MAGYFFNSNEELLDFIIKTADDLGITGYDIGQNTTVTEQTGYAILQRKTKNPRKKTLLEILEFIESRQLGSGVPKHKNYIPGRENIIEEPTTDYSTKAQPVHPKNEIERLEDVIRMKDQVIELLTEQRDMLKERNGELSEKVALLDERLKKADKQRN